MPFLNKDENKEDTRTCIDFHKDAQCCAAGMIIMESKYI